MKWQIKSHTIYRKRRFPERETTEAHAAQCELILAEARSCGAPFFCVAFLQLL